MTTFKRLLLNLLLLTAVATIYTSCEVEDGIDGIDGADGANGQDGADGEDGEDFTPEPEMFSDKSNLKALVAMKPQFNYVNAYSILSSSDTLSNDFKLVGAQDGAGFLKDPDSDGYIYIVNAEDTLSSVHTLSPKPKQFFTKVQCKLSGIRMKSPLLFS